MLPTFPSNFSFLKNLIAENELTGSIPTEVGSLTTLEIYLIAENGLTGSIPTEIGSLTKLERLFLCKQLFLFHYYTLNQGRRVPCY